MFHDRLAEQRFAELQKQYGFLTCYETGTHLGIGALRASPYCNVMTIDINDEFRTQARETWLANGFVVIQDDPKVSVFNRGQSFISSLLGSSPEVLDKSLEFEGTLTSAIQSPPVCFYLDAHWLDYWPLRDELKVIARHRQGQDVIMIHDCKVPGKDFLYDSYAGQDLCYEYVADLLKEINPGYRISYNEACEPRDEPYSGARGILYALPQTTYCPRCEKWSLATAG